MSDIQVFAMRILTFSNRFGEFTAMTLSRMKPEKESGKNAIYRKNEYGPSSRYESVSFPPTFLMI
jgi:hypothetical protein